MVRVVAWVGSMGLRQQVVAGVVLVSLVAPSVVVVPALGGACWRCCGGAFIGVAAGIGGAFTGHAFTGGAFTGNAFTGVAGTGGFTKGTGGTGGFTEG